MTLNSFADNIRGPVVCRFIFEVRSIHIQVFVGYENDFLNWLKIECLNLNFIEKDHGKKRGFFSFPFVYYRSFLLLPGNNLNSWKVSARKREEEEEEEEGIHNMDMGNLPNFPAHLSFCFLFQLSSPSEVRCLHILLLPRRNFSRPNNLVSC